MKKYYIVENGKQTGPFSFDEIKERKISKDTLVWYTGLEKWRKAEIIDEFKELFTAPPPVNEVENEHEEKLPPIPNQEKFDNKDFELAPIGARFGGYLLVNAIVLILFFAIGGTIEELEYSEGFFKDMVYAGLGGGIINGIFYPFFSGNLGHKLLGLKVVHLETGDPMNNLFHGFLREFQKGVFGMVIIPVIWLLFDEKRQNVYDKIEKTIVVKNKK